MPRLICFLPRILLRLFPVSLLLAGLAFPGCSEPAATPPENGAAQTAQESTPKKEQPAAPVDDRPEWEKEAGRHMESDDSDAAIAVVDRVLATEPRNVTALVFRAYTRSYRQEFDKALADVEAALKIEPKNAKAWVCKGDTLAVTPHSDLAKAREAYETAIACDEGSARAWYGIAGVDGLLGNYERAVTAATKALELDPKDSTYHASRAIALESLDRHKEAIRDYSTAIELAPKDLDSYLGRGDCNYALEKYEDAKRDYDKFLELDAESPIGYERRAEVYVRMGDYDHAREDIRAAIAHTPDDLGANYQPISASAPTDEDLRHGEEQLQAILRDRPQMAQYVKPGDALWTWAVRKLGAEAVGEPVYWDARPPKPLPAEHRVPTDTYVGAIRIHKGDSDKPDQASDAFTDLWSCLIFELHNIAFKDEFLLIYDEVASGKLSPDEFVSAMWRVERKAVQQTRAFYADVFLPWAKEAGLPPHDPTNWYVTAIEGEDASVADLGQEYVSYYADWHEVMLAQADCDAGDYTECRRRVESVLRRESTLDDDSRAHANFVLGCSMLLIGNEKGALESFEKAVALDDQWAGEYYAPAKARLYFGKHLEGDEARKAGALFLRGSVWLDHGELTKALIDFDEAIRIDPKYLAAFVQRAEVRYEMDQYDQCLVDLDPVFQANPQHVTAIGLRGRAREMKNEMDRALDDYAEYVRIAPRQSWGWLCRGRVLRDTGEYEKSLSDFDEAIRLAPKSAEAYVERANAHFAKQNYPACSDDLLKALAIDDLSVGKTGDASQPGEPATKRVQPALDAEQFAHVQSLLVACQLAAGDEDQALASARKAVAADSGFASEGLIDGFLMPETNTVQGVQGETAQAAAAHYLRGCMWHHLENEERALADIEEALRIEPDFFAAYVKRAQLKYIREQYDDCLADLEQAIRRNPDVARVYHLRGSVWVAKGERDKALADMDEYVRRAKDDPECWYVRGETRYQFGDVAGALADFGWGITAHPDNSQSYVGRAQIKQMQGEYDSCIADLDKAIQLDPDDAYAHQLRAWSWAAKLENDKAIADMDEYVRLEESSAASLCTRGELYVAFEDDARASADFEAAIQADPEYAPGYGGRAAVRCKRGELEAGIADFDKALALDPDYSGVYRTRGMAWAESEQYDKALSDLQQYVKLVPDDPEGWRAKAWVLCEQGDFKQALADANKSLELLPNYAVAFAVRGHIREKLREYTKSLADFNKAVELAPDGAFALVYRASFLSECPDKKFRDTKRAIADATRACELTKWEYADYLSTLAGCYAEAGDFKKAVEWQAKAVASAKPHQKPEFQRDLDRLKAGKTLREEKARESKP